MKRWIVLETLDRDLGDYRRRVVGAKQTLKALERENVARVYIAGDAEENVVEPVLALCAAKGLKPYRVPSMDELGRMCGIKVRAAAAAVIES